MAAAAIGSVVSALVYIAVAATLARRETSPESRIAAVSFVAWWYALAASTGIGGLRLLTGMAGVRDLALYAAMGDLSILIICFGLGSLLYHLLYLYTGRIGLWKPLLVFYLLYAAALLYYLARMDPTGIEVSRWSVRTVYGTTMQRGPFFHLLLALLVLPQVAAAFAYFLLFFRVRERSKRFRIATVSWSIIIWFASTYVVALGQFSSTDAWQVASRLLALGATFAILTAYRPPVWLRRRLDIEPVVGPSGARA